MDLPKEVIWAFGLYEARDENMQDVLDEEEICTQDWEEAMLRGLEYREMETGWTLYVFRQMYEHVWTYSIDYLLVLSEHNYSHTILGFKILNFSRFHAYHQIRSNYIPPRAFASESKTQGFGIFPTYLDSKQSFGLD